MIGGTIAIRQRSIIPGFGLSLGVTLSYLGLIVMIPLCVLLLKASDAGWAKIWMELSSPRTLAAFRVSFGIAFLAAAFNAVFGFIVAWVLVRYEFFGRRLLDAMIDLPFALPTAVAGISLTQIYAGNGWLGSALAKTGIKVAFTPLGILVALVFVGVPFVVRTVQPVLQDFDRETEEAGALLGASRWNILRRVVFPPLIPALMTGFTLAFARGIGEYGSVIFIAGNMPGLSEIVPLLIVIKLEQFDYAGASAIGVAMLLLSFLILLAINFAQVWMRRRYGA
jgi:sulfate/thiosulfate transport system permease protein